LLLAGNLAEELVEEKIVPNLVELFVIHGLEYLKTSVHVSVLAILAEELSHDEQYQLNHHFLHFISNVILRLVQPLNIYFLAIIHVSACQLHACAYFKQ